MRHLMTHVSFEENEGEREQNDSSNRTYFSTPELKRAPGQTHLRQMRLDLQPPPQVSTESEHRRRRLNGPKSHEPRSNEERFGRWHEPKKIALCLLQHRPEEGATLWGDPTICLKENEHAI